MKVRELIEQLRGEDQDAEVHIAYNYGDHSRTTVAPRIVRIEEATLRNSDYHRMPTVVDEDDESEKPGDRTAVVLFTPGS